MKFFKNTLSLLFTAIFATTAGAQISFNLSVPTEITVCGDPKTFGVAFTNTTNGTLAAPEITVTFPTGMTYVVGSIGGGATEKNIGNLGSPKFSAPDLAPGAAATFSVQARATFSAYAAAQGGTIFKNTVLVAWSGGSKSGQTQAYNVLYPALTITAATDATVIAGQTFTRTVTVVNGGYGATAAFTLTDQFDNNLSLISVSKGTLSSNIVSFSGADFAATGDGDGFFEQNEAFTFTQTFRAIGCSSTQSTLTARWGCDGSMAESNRKFPKTTISVQEPKLNFTATPAFDACFPAAGNEQKIQIKNTGTGLAKNTTLTIAPENAAVYTRMDVAGIAFQNGAGAVSMLTPTATTNAAAHACLGQNPKSGFTVVLPDIAPGETVFVKWKALTCATTACGDVYLAGWKHSATYTNNCNSATYTNSGNGQPMLRKNFTVFPENPSDLVNAQTGAFNFTLPTAIFSMPTTPRGIFQAEFDLPAGLDWSGSNADLVFTSGAAVWSPTSVNFDASTRKLTAKYPLPVPMTLPFSEFRLRLKANCATVSANPASLGFALYYIADTACPGAHKYSLTCYSTTSVRLHCPGNGCLGMAFGGFSVKRHSTGAPDNDRNGLPDAGGSLDFSKILLNRVMAGDTFKTVFSGKTHVNGQYPRWDFAYAASTMPRGTSVTALFAQISVKVAATGQTLTATLATPMSNSVSGGKRTTKWNLSPANLGATFAGFSYGEGDEVTLTAFYKLSGNIGATMEQAIFTNEFYTTPTANSNSKFQCDTWDGNLTLAGYLFSNYKSDQYDITTCTRTIVQTFGLFIGQTATAGGMDFFPFEYRNWAKLQDVKLSLPTGYALISSNFTQNRTTSGNATAAQTTAVSPATNGQEFAFDLSNFYNSGVFATPDDGFHGTLEAVIKPNCSISTALNDPVNWSVRFKEAAILSGNVGAWVPGTPDRVRYKPAVLGIGSPDPIAEASAPEVSWDVDLSNATSTEAPNAWFFLKNETGKIAVLSVKNRATNATISPDANGFYRLNSVAAGGKIGLRIRANFTACQMDELKISSGYGCDGYPSNFNALPCPVQQFKLFAEPQPAELQVKTSSSLPAGTACPNRVTLEAEFLSAKLGNVSDIELRISPHGGADISLAGGSTFFKYPAAQIWKPFQTPGLSGGAYSMLAETIVPGLAAAGLPGVLKPDSNLLKLKCDLLLGPDYRPGDLVLVQIFSKKVCGAALSASAFYFDPAAVFEKKTGIGLDGAFDAWSAAWVDYDSDGDPDIFATTPAATDPNLMFRNNGNGTFTKITAGAIATENSMAYASTWADVDNDGDLDGFVNTDVGQKKLLWLNNGNGSFSKIYPDPTGKTDPIYGRGAAWADFDNDGFVDLFLANFFSTKFSQLLRNNGDGTFSQANSAVSQNAASSVSGVWGDCNGDGLSDLFVCNTNDEDDFLYKNLGGGKFEKTVFADGGKSVGASWADVDNDGDLDLFVANGGNQADFLYKNDGSGAFSRSILQNGGNSTGSSFADFDNDGDLDLLLSNDEGQRNRLFSNDGTGAFSAVESNVSAETGNFMANAWADYDGDGDLDALVVGRDGGGLTLFKNAGGQCRSSLCLNLVGTKSNRSAIGAVVRVKAEIFGKTVWQMRQISAQTGGSTGSQNDLRALFGLGDATVADSVLVEWPSGVRQVLGNLAAGQCHTLTEPDAAKICGKIYFDNDENCQADAGESVLPGKRILVQPGNFYAVSGDDGNFEVWVAPGKVYTLSADPGAGFNYSCNDGNGLTINVLNAGQEYCGNDFGLSATCAEPDLDVQISAGALRTGFQNIIQINYRNLGAMAATGVSLTADFGNVVEPQTASLAWASESGTTRTWALPDLAPGENGAIFVTGFVAANKGLGLAAEVEASLACSEPECNTANNLRLMSEQTVGAFDPNDLLVSPEGGVHPGDLLTYKIRFQNVGTFLAKKVVVEDLLPAGFDLSTLEMGTASHPYRLQISDEGRRLRWVFDNINLPDSVSNEPESHGFITFRVRVADGLERGDILENVADIQFDNQAVIRTNSTYNYLKNSDLDLKPAPGQLLALPNPATVFTEILAPETDALPTQLCVFNLGGSEVAVFENPFANGALRVPTADWLPGVYFFRASDGSGGVWTGKLVVVR